jgi:hypothetical protein
MDIGYEDQRQIIARIWRDLNLILMNAVSIDDLYIILKLFIQRFYTQEYAARHF